MGCKLTVYCLTEPITTLHTVSVRSKLRKKIKIGKEIVYRKQTPLTPPGYTEKVPVITSVSRNSV